MPDRPEAGIVFNIQRNILFAVSKMIKSNSF